MESRSAQALLDELGRLMLEHIESLKTATFLTLTEEQLRQQKELLQRIREVSADYLAAAKREDRLP